MKKRWAVVVLFSATHLLHAQSVNEQIWVEYMLNYPFANSFNLENAFTYNTVLSSPAWRSYEWAPTVEWSVHSHIDILAQTTLSYTNQSDSYNTFEVRPALGTRFYFTPNKRIQTKLLLRLEQRNFRSEEHT